MWEVSYRSVCIAIFYQNVDKIERKKKMEKENAHFQTIKLIDQEKSGKEKMKE